MRHDGHTTTLGSAMADLAASVADHYQPDEYPALRRQIDEWAESRPLDGFRVLDATPIFRNTMTKYLALQLGGAHVTVARGPGIPSDEAVVSHLPGFGIRVAGDATLREEYDVVFDCAGAHAGVRSCLGFVELTESGRAVYAGCPQPVLLVDAGRVKRIETTLGTGDGFVRAMAQLGYGDLDGRRIVVFGGGKVGSGIVRATRRAGARVTVVDPMPLPLPLPLPLPPGCERVDLADAALVRRVIGSAWCVVTATGVPGALATCAPDLLSSPALLANMGAEDEFGPRIPPGRALAGKQPLNFVLAEPTRLAYLDPTFALSNRAALVLARGDLGPGVHAPTPAIEAGIVQDVIDHGAISAEVESLIEEGGV